MLSLFLITWGWHVIQHDDVIKWTYFQRYWPFVRGIHRSPVNSPHKGQWRGALMFTLICAWINDWVNNRKADDLRRYRTHYDVTVMELVDEISRNLTTLTSLDIVVEDLLPMRSSWRWNEPPTGRGEVSVLDGAMFDIQILAHLVNRMNKSQFYLGYDNFAWPFSFHFMSIEFGRVIAKFHYINQNCSSSSGRYIIAARISTSVLRILLSFRSIVNWFRVTFSNDVST